MTYDIVIVGGGIVGLATAHRLLEARPGVKLRVLERESEVGTGQSSHNSGVLHAGLYYPPGSRKAVWCRQGKEAYERFAAEHGVPVERTGKLVVAVEPREIPRLRGLVDRARTNGVEIYELDAAGLKEHEPNVAGIAGAWTPETAVTDFGAACHALARAITDAGGEVSTGVEVLTVTEGQHRAQITTTDGDIEASVVIACAGLSADRVAAAAGTPTRERIMPFRGSWLVLKPEKGDLVKGNIYPVPLPGLPFLGVHLTRRIDGEIWIGPNAVLAGARHGAGMWSMDRRDIVDVARFSGTWRLALRHTRTAVGELTRDRIMAANLREVRKYVPGITSADVRRGPWGVRAQLVDRNGDLVDDFVLRGEGRVLHVLNAPSPAATASLAIGAELRDQALARLA
ncbi:MAG: L-2-hydroxyglutarate oxidase [Nitriliruptoraceae bacterium]